MRPDSSIHWSAYPALLLAGAFALGIVLDSALGSVRPPLWMAGAASGVFLFGLVEWWDRSALVTLAPLGRVVAIFLVVVSAGGARHGVYWHPSPRALAPIAEASEEATTVRGTVQDAPERTEEAIRFTASVDSILGVQDTSVVEGRMRVTLRPSPWASLEAPFPRLAQGDVVQLRGDLQRPPGLRNPGGFDYAAYLFRRGVCCVMYVDAPKQVVVKGDQRGTLGAGLVSARRYIRRQLAWFVPSEEGRAVLRALLLGDRSRISDAQQDRFKTTGLMHLLAVSGLHVFLVGMVLYTLLRPLLMRFHLRWRTVELGRAAFTVGVLSFYMLLTGARPSVVRAVVMATLFIGGIVLQRSAHSLNTLGVAMLVLLSARPTALFDVGFQLSMAAVAGIVTLNPRFLDALPEWHRGSTVVDWVVSTGTASAAAILGTAPVLLYHFGWVSVAGLLLNMVGIPCTGLALTAAIVAVLSGGVWPLFGAAFGSAADLFVRGLLATSQYGAQWFSWAGIRMETPELWALGALAGGVVAMAQWPRPRLRWRCLIAALLLAAVSIWGKAVGRAAEPSLDVVFFDVGHGDAALISTPTGRHVLVDSGPRSPSGSSGEYVVLPFLEQYGIGHLDAVVVTHPDGDHLGGLPAILKEVAVKQVYHSGQASGTELFEETRALMKRLEIPTRALHRGDTLAFGPSVRAQVLGPPEASTPTVRGENNRSVVIHVAYGTTDVLLTGDIEAEAERDLVRTYGNALASRVVKVPHHGSSTSSTPSFVKAADDSSEVGIAVISVGQGDRYGMPSRQVLARWQEARVKVRSTARTGAVWLRSNGRRMWEVAWR